MSYQPTRISRQKVHLSDIPIDILYNSQTNQIKAAAFSGVTTSYIPIHFKVEHESFAQGGDYDVTYTAQINGVDIEATQKVHKIDLKRTANARFARTLKQSQPTRRESISNPIAPRVFDHLRTSAYQSQQLSSQVSTGG